MAEKGREIYLVDRSELRITGVREVVSFDESSAVLLTEDGELNVDGANIHILGLDTGSGEVSITGRIDALVFSEDTAEKRRGFLGKLFG
ncbi:MAG: sporulation protein YabP [Clostridia bacterium]|nr:sporulation protein YabP [Clostridia bacterium]